MYTLALDNVKMICTRIERALERRDDCERSIASVVDFVPVNKLSHERHVEAVNYVYNMF